MKSARGSRSERGRFNPNRKPNHKSVSHKLPIFFIRTQPQFSIQRRNKTSLWRRGGERLVSFKLPVSQAGPGNLRPVRTCPAREFAPRIHGCAGLGSLPSCGKFLMKFYVRLRRLRGPEAMRAPPGPATCPLTRAGFIPREDDFTGGGSRTLPPQLPGRDRCRPGVLGAVSKSRRTHAPPLASFASLVLLSPPTALGLHALALSPSLSTGSVQAALDYDGNRKLASVWSSCRRASLPPLHRSPSL